MKKPANSPDPERTARKIVADCAGCDCCRPIMDESCLFFPELYRLHDAEVETGCRISAAELRQLVDKCNFCALCPCPDIRADIIRAKTGFIERDGLKPGVRTLEDVERVARICGAFPRLANRLLRSQAVGPRLRGALGIHRERKLPEFRGDPFPPWARRRGLHLRKEPSAKRRVAYFAGCTARHLFPEVARATVAVLERNGVEVYYPEQKCCGMPSFLEGDRALTLEFAGDTLAQLAEAARGGYDIVCSCPTCSFMLRFLLAEGACYAPAYQESVGADPRFIKVPARPGPGGPAARKFEVFGRSIFGNILKDEGYFSGLDPLARAALAEKTFDVGEYLLGLHRSGELDTGFSAPPAAALYFPPCHLREQEIGQPQLELMGLIRGLEVAAIQGNLYCCGLAGVMGFKRDFHEASLRLGGPLIEKINQLDPERIVTDCLSCRIQFNQMLPHRVLHPVEILEEAYRCN